TGQYVSLHASLNLRFIFFLMINRQQTSTLFPYTTLFRSDAARLGQGVLDGAPGHLVELDAADRAVLQAQGRDQVPGDRLAPGLGDRKSTRLNSSHVANSYAVFCLKKKTTNDFTPTTKLAK